MRITKQQATLLILAVANKAVLEAKDVMDSQRRTIECLKADVGALRARVAALEGNHDPVT